MTATALAGTIEELAANAWPASVVHVVDGWRLRATPGIEARRSNSVLPNGGTGAVDLEHKLAIVDEFYARRGLPVRFQMSPAAVPADLDDVLTAGAFEIEAAADIQVADIAEVVARSESRASATRVDIASEPDGRWLDTMLGVTPRGERDTLRHTIFDRIGPVAKYASIVEADRAIAVGMGVVERGWLGVFSMATLPEARRRGAATAILHALTAAGMNEGATRAYLQTERANAPSHALYEGVGFHTAYGYHYRTRR